MEEQKIKYSYNQGVILVNDDMIFLTPNENELFNILLQNKGKLVSKEQIYDALYTDDFDAYSIMLVNQRVCRLRKKIKPIFMILNKPGLGYILIKNNKSLRDNMDEDDFIEI